MCTNLALLANPYRQEILRLAWMREQSAGQIARRFPVTFGAVSQHLAKLTAAGLVRRRRDGRRILYVADRAALGPLAAALEAMWSERLAVLKNLAEAAEQRTDRSRAAPVASGRSRRLD